MHINFYTIIFGAIACYAAGIYTVMRIVDFQDTDSISPQTHKVMVCGFIAIVLAILSYILLN